MELIEAQAPRSLRKYLLGALPSKSLEFEMAVFAERNLQTYETEIIKKWLFGNPHKYDKLFILQDDMRDIYFECYLNDPKDVHVNGNNGWSFTVHCNAGGAWENEKVATYNPATGETIKFLNTSGDNDYMYPIVEFKMSANGGFSITNKSDNNRVFGFTGLTNNEVITCDGQTGIVTSSIITNRRLANFNKKYLRLISGINNLECTGNVEYVKIRYINFRRIGG